MNGNSVRGASSANVETPLPVEILVVDDALSSLRILGDMLEEAGYRVRATDDPGTGLDAALQELPLLIVLDTRMPGMDGFEVCRRLKQDERTQDIPIIFVSSLNDTKERVRGFEAGGVDYVSRPYQEQEVLARVRSHTRLRSMQLGMERRVEERTAQLREEIATHKEAEDNLRQELNEYQSLAELGSWSWEVDSDVVTWSKNMRELVGWGLDSPAPSYEENRKLYAERSWKQLNKAVERALNLAEPYELNLSMRRLDGKTLEAVVRGRAVKDESGRVVRLHGTVQDVTARVRVQRELAQSEDRFRELVRQSPLSVQIFSPDGRIEEVNKAFSDMWGIPDEDLPEVLANYNVLEDEEARKHGVMPLVEKAFKGEAVILPAIEYDAGETMNAIGVNTEAEKVWIQARLYPILNDKGDVVRVVDLEEDVTGQKRARESEERFQALIEQSPLAIEIHSVDGKFLMSNPAYSRISGLHGTALEAVYESFDLRHDKQHQSLGHGPLLDRLYAGEAIEFPPYAYNVSDEAATLGIQVPDGGSLWIRSIGFPLKDDGGRTEAVVVMTEDITDIKAAEQELQKYQQRLQALGLELTISEERERRRIATELHDEAAQSLSLARLQLAAAAKRVGDEATRSRLDDASQLLKDSLQQIRELVLDLSSPALNEIGLAAATSEWVDEHLRRRYGLSASFTDNCGDLEVDDDVLALLFRNIRELLTNVVKHARATRVSVRFDYTGDALRITVADDGRGLAASETKRTPSDEGGFGLFSVRERVRDLGGTLEIESAPGKGCTVRMSLPLERLRERGQL